MRALVTGGGGFVGRRFVGALIEQGYSVDVVDDLSTGLHPDNWPSPVLLRPGATFSFTEIDIRDFMRQAEASDYELILHLAAVVGGRIKIENAPLQVATDLAIDADFFAWVTRAALPGKVAYFSSSAAYPVAAQTRKGPTILHETMIDFEASAIGVPDMTYGWAKLTGEFLAQHAAVKHGLDVACYRPFSGYGEEQDPSYPFTSILRRVAAREAPVVVWGSGQQARDFIHIEDVVGAVLASLNHLSGGQAINLGTGEPTSFIDLARLACETLGYKPEVVPDPSKPEGVFWRVADCTRMLEFYQPRVHIREGVSRTLDYLSSIMNSQSEERDRFDGA